MERIIWIALWLALLCCGCHGPAEQSSGGLFTMSWENAFSWDDAPDFGSERLDKETSRFSKVQAAGSLQHYFPDGRISVELGQSRGEAAAARIAEAVGRQIFKDEKMYRMKLVQRCRFGYYAYIDWGVREEKYTGHYVKLMVDLDKQIIWWIMCS
ncbi:MAG TPA: hypothetical protein VMX13_06775 [Sedimentisphaerales bacterium]|nr:hypothetical protein [Sedimentisphaerales bacterium]